MMHQIVIADTHSIFRETLRHSLNNRALYEVAGEADSAESTMSQLNADVDILILELLLSKDDVFSLISRVRSEYPQLKIVILSMHSQQHVIKKALSLGVDAYVSKSSNISHLYTALQKVLAGHKYISENISEILLNSLNQKNQLPHQSLSHRELEVFTMLGKGISINQIASQLALSAKTISTHKSRIMQKMNLTSNAALIKYYLNSEFNPSLSLDETD